MVFIKINLVYLTKKLSFKPETESFVWGHLRKNKLIKLPYEETSFCSGLRGLRRLHVNASHLWNASWHVCRYFTEGEIASTKDLHSRKLHQLLPRVLGRSQVWFSFCLDWNREAKNLQLHCLKSLRRTPGPRSMFWFRQRESTLQAQSKSTHLRAVYLWHFVQDHKSYLLKRKELSSSFPHLEWMHKTHYSMKEKIVFCWEKITYSCIQPEWKIQNLP